MIKRLLLIATMATASMGSFAADLVGTWNVRNLNNITQEEGVAQQQLGQGADFCFGILGTAETIEFKADGSFFCNDSIYGTYTYKNDQLILNRDEKLINKTIEKLSLKDSIQEDSDYMKEILKGYACDCLLISFTKQGHKALLEGNQQRDLVKALPINLSFVIDKQGTNGKNEDLNEGKSIIGKKYKMSMMGMVEMAFTFKKNGKCIGESGGFGKMEKKEMTYAINGNKLSIYEKDAPSLEGEYIFSKDGFLFLFSNPSMTLALTFWEVK